MENEKKKIKRIKKKKKNIIMHDEWNESDA